MFYIQQKDRENVHSSNVKEHTGATTERRPMILPTSASIACDDLLDSSDVHGSLPDTEHQFQTVNEINAEARALIASWERNLCPIDYEPCHSAHQLRAMWAAAGTHSITTMPPPMRYRRVSKNAFIG